MIEKFGFSYMVKKTMFILVILLMVSAGWAAEQESHRVWHVCMRCPDKDAPSISDALRQANPKDTILVYWEPDFPYYMEQLVIDKPVRIISTAAAGDMMNYDYYPVIVSVSPQVVHIRSPGVELIGFNIMYLQKPEECHDKRACYSDTVGIRLEAPATIRQVAITNCSTGILAVYDNEYLKTGSIISHCRIGLPPDHGLTETGFSQTRNHYGIVLLGARQDGPGRGTGRDKITNCIIMRNTQYGLVYTSRNEPVRRNNTIEFNAGGPFRVVRPELDDQNRFVWIDTPADDSD
jgi:hypothetical protein